MKKRFFIVVYLFCNLLFAQVKPETISDKAFDNKSSKDLIQAKDSIKADSISRSTSEKSYFKTKMSFTSNYSYNGRTDATTIPYLAPYIGYFDSSGFNISTSLYYSIGNNLNRVELIMLDLGYDHQVNDRLILGAYANKTSYNSSSSVMSSSIKTYAGGYIDYDFKYFNITLENSLLFSQKTDFSFTPTLYKEFDLSDKESLTITPTILANFSSLNYYEDYSNKKAKKKNNQSSVSVDTTVDDKKFTLLDYEFSAPIEFKVAHFVFFATPMVAIPLHQVRTTSVYTTHATNGTIVGVPLVKDSTEPSELNLKTKFFIDIGVFYKF